MEKRVSPEKLGRRQFAGGAAAAVGASVLGASVTTLGMQSIARAAPAGPEGECEHVGPLPITEGLARTPGIRVDPRARKPIYLPAERAGLAAKAVAEILFWTDILMEHALFFTMLMPGDRLAGQRQEARRFQGVFAQHFVDARDACWTDGALSRLLTPLQSSVRDFITYKRQMQQEQERGQLQSLVWPLFFDHVAREAERFSRRLDQFAAGNAALQLDEVAGFWTTIMADHLDFVAHLLDPQERKLVAKAMAKAQEVYRAHDHRLERGQLSTMADEIIDFKTAAEQGIETGAIKSIIDPALADHVLREAVKFSDDVKRA